ncbi:helix-turn-helix domain-containing protein [Acinetobacter haemolyticus]|uniref:Helix-turn-helix domain-containing protein n=1 Tax=Acinetobacter haemolyticus TaxID=29430 RepID=A0AAJ2YRA1_ACIHA|nr:XRE family transcriptional regulator [Acinetobacter haemolyticus]NAR17970.1 helix-turn-helix domain-containing protein [Acinetobacter haemolyticus]NAR29760.1 helix-turn-helix domain-containing protein [Acinetobacter haemolyticus]NAR35361.1 helix-turn-helix domain-containing protein [Acinetobacter haemolyticus]NAR49079.1 helix-turn-helix domain-containing protein [Acinetobacter haemolyticus]NAR65343.1 helix-turn-helix domain-containing protein [Acinetobacter haemolyticus]
MAKPISELFNTLSVEDQAAVETKAAEMITAMRLANLRKQLGFTQAQVAGAMHIKQPTVAQLEKRADIQLSTLRQYLHVLGANLEINATLPDGSRINLTGL